jgi:outer membrane protein assembly factor BamB
MGNVDGNDVVTCLNVENGAVVWQHRYPCPAGQAGWGPLQSGPRATPTLDGDRLYTMSHDARVFCLATNTGKPLWECDLKPQAGAQESMWGYSGSPLVEGDLVILNAGAAGVALDRRSGQVAWQSGPGQGGYSSPVLYEAAGQRGVALFTASNLVGLEPATGRRLWQFRFASVADPVVIGDRLFLSLGASPNPAQQQCALIRLGAEGPTELWRNQNMRNDANTSVLVGGQLYGNDKNALRCIDLETGAERWGEKGIGLGGLIAADGKLLVLTERGELLVVKAAPESYQELARTKLLEGTSYTAPTLANGRLYCRNHAGDLVCLDLRPRDAGRVTPAAS